MKWRGTLRVLLSMFVALSLSGCGAFGLLAKKPVAKVTGKELTDTRIVEKEVTKEVEVTKVIEVTKVVEKEKEVTKVVEVKATPVPTAMPSTTATVVLSSTATSALSVSACRHELWVTEAFSRTKGVSELIAVLDRDYQGSEGGQWSEAGYTVPAGSMFWTDLFQNVSNLPSGVQAIRVQGGWGVYRNSSVPYVIPNPNGGGRWMRICEVVSNLPALAAAMPITPTISVATLSVSATVAPTQVFTCISRVEMGVIIGKDDFVKEYNNFFEGRGYQFGGSLDKGGTIPAGSFFLGTFSGDGPSGGAKNLKGGLLWEITQGIKAENGGRWMRICSK